MPFNKKKYDAVMSSIKTEGYILFGPRVLVLRDDPVKETAGGLVIPDQAQTTEKSGTVLALGQGYMEAGEKEYTKGVEVGMHILFNTYDGVAVNIPTRTEGTIVCQMLHVGNLYIGMKNKEVG